VPQRRLDGATPTFDVADGKIHSSQLICRSQFVALVCSEILMLVPRYGV
jgi:hypothetical protein